MMQTVMMIQGKRVLLRSLKEGDIEEGVRTWTPELTYLYGGSLRVARQPTVERLRQKAAAETPDPNDHRFCIEADGRYIGHVALRTNDVERSGHLRIGITNPEYWGRGYGTEVTRLILRYAFETLNLHRVALRVTAYNMRARRCYEKCGFRVEGIERESFLVDGEWQSDVLMALLRHEWEACAVGAQHVVPLPSLHNTSTEEVTIRPYRSIDHPAVIALLELTGFHHGLNDTAERIAWKLATQPGFFLVAETDGRLIGTIIGSIERGWGWIQRLAVHPDYRRRGIAKRLIAEAERAHAALGAYRTVLLTHRDNEAAQALYYDLGYELWEGVIVMGKTLVPSEPMAEEHCCEC